MTRRGFLKRIFKATVAAPIVPVVIKHSPGLFERCLKWIQRKLTPKPTGWASFAMPLIKRTFPTLLAKDIVGIQPMNLPNAQIFYLDMFENGKKVEYDGPSTPYNPADYPDNWLDIKE